LNEFACLCDAFGKLNKLNISMQRPDKNMLDVSDKIAGLWKGRYDNIVVEGRYNKSVVKF